MENTQNRNGLLRNGSEREHLARLEAAAEELESLRNRYDSILGPEVTACRVTQDTEHGGPVHDDTHTPGDWCVFIRKFVGRAEYQSQFLDHTLALSRYEENLIHVIGLAVSAIHSSRRIHKQAVSE